MKKLCLASLVLLSTVATAAEEFNGSVPMSCEPTKGFDCLPAESSCKQIKAEKGRDMKVHVDVANMSLRSPNKTAPLPIASFGFNSKSLVMQGTSLDLVWSATVNRTTGKLTLAIADREGAYVIFGQCKLEPNADAAQ